MPAEKPALVFNLWHVLTEVETNLPWGAGVNDLDRSDPGEGQASKYALMIADTYLIEDSGPTLLTNLCPRNWSDAAYFFKVGHVWD